MACAEHGLNASTFAARVIVATRSDLASTIVGAIGALKGPLHGGAPAEVLGQLDEIGSVDRAEAWARDRLGRRELIMGFGHRVYRAYDPRAAALREAFDKAMVDPELRDAARKQNMDLQPMTGREAARLAAQIRATPADIVAIARKLEE